MFEIHPDAIETQQADQLVDAGIGKVAGGHQGRLAPTEFSFDPTEAHVEPGLSAFDNNVVLG